MPSNIQLFRNYNHNPVFIETGSFQGDGIRNALFAGYKEIHSIELAESHYLNCKSSFKYIENVHLYFGDSVEELPRIMENLKESATFWLDAHYSGYGTDFKNTLTPLLKELEIIKEHPLKNHTILIDDLRCWKRDYPAIQFGLDDLKEKILEINPDYVFSFAQGGTLNDILVADTRKHKPMNIIVFSKDRAMQLDLFLRSFNKFVSFAGNYNIKVLYTHSNDNFRAGYEKLISTTPPNVTFIKETNFKQDVIQLIDTNNPYMIFFVDDNIFKEYFDFYDKQMDIFEWDERIACRSLRLHKHLSYCYSMQKPMRQPKFLDNNIFNWTEMGEDYGYPMSVDGHIFRTKDVYDFFVDMDYSSPNTLEGQLVHQRNKMGRNMICYDKSPIMNNPMNRVQDVCKNVCGVITAESLNEKFLENLIIDLSTFEGLENTACHQEVTPNFIQR
jgi:hypothetical protein